VTKVDENEAVQKKTQSRMNGSEMMVRYQAYIQEEVMALNSGPNVLADNSIVFHSSKFNLCGPKVSSAKPFVYPEATGKTP